MTDKTNELKDAVQKIANWEMPKTGKYWDDEKTQEMSYGACYGTQGEQLIIQDYAQNALTILAGYDHAAAELRWIPIRSADDLPKESGEYLFQYRDDDMTPFTLWPFEIQETPSLGINGPKVGESKGAAFEVKTFIAWMPLPKPYTEPSDNIAEVGEREGV